MEFLEDLFDFGDRKRKKHDEPFRQGNRDDHHDDHDDDEHCHDDHHHNHPINAPQLCSANLAVPQIGLFCARCSTQLFPGAKFCHQCGTAIEAKPICASCGSNLPANAPFCPQCGYKNG